MKTPRSVTMAVIRWAGVASNAGLRAGGVAGAMRSAPITTRSTSPFAIGEAAATSAITVWGMPPWRAPTQEVPGTCSRP
ncbi:MAG TPA: hypothetical protein VLA62_11790, partial [Solirubrobacterales bacterium]|nr:hypothetical protein [Solirubrobacterales bacterium]